MAHSKSVTNKPTITIRMQPKQIVIVLTLVLLLYVVIPQLGSFKHSFSLISQAHTGWILFGAASYLGSAITSAFVYRLLAPRHLPLGRTTLVLYGSNFANRLLPAGIGALGVGYFYLRKQKCSQSETLAVITLNNILGLLGHGLLLLGVVLFVPATFVQTHVALKLDGQTSLAIGIGVVLLAGYILILRNFRRRIVDIVSATVHQLSGYRKKLAQVAGALIFSIGLTMLHVICLWASAKALNIDISLAQSIIILAAGVALGAAVPSPGGLGGAEAGLVAGLVAFQVPVASSVAIAILYRLATYWLGFVVGAGAFFVAEKKDYF